MWLTLLQSFAFARADDDAPGLNGEHIIGDGETGFNFPSFGDKPITTEDVMKMLDSVTGLSDDEKDKLRDDLLTYAKDLRQKATGGIDPAQINPMQTIMLFSLLGLIALIFVFFVYKLFKILSEREQKKEEKKRSKQSKKKK
ncbi:uncharacterized protein [Prorops nasuta]